MDINDLEDKHVEADNITLGAIATLGNKVEEIDSSLQVVNYQVDKLKQARQDITFRQLPEMMSSVEMTEFKLDSGKRVTKKKFYNGKLVDPNACFEWLKDNNAYDLVKEVIELQFDPSEKEKIAAAKKVLDEAGIPYEINRGIHHKTLKGFIKECDESGVAIPHDIFGITIGEFVEIK